MTALTGDGSWYPERASPMPRAALAVDERTNRVFLLTEAPGYQPFPTHVSLLDARSGGACALSRRHPDRLADSRLVFAGEDAAIQPVSLEPPSPI
jgi:hypothetical protein